MICAVEMYLKLSLQIWKETGMSLGNCSIYFALVKV